MASRLNSVSPSSVVLAVGVVKIGVNACDINNFTWMVLEGNINDCFEDTLHFCGDILVACLTWSKTESSAFSCSFWATSPADWANAISLCGAVWIA